MDKNSSPLTDRIVLRRQGGSCRGCGGVLVVVVCGDVGGGWHVVLDDAALWSVTVVLGG